MVVSPNGSNKFLYFLGTISSTYIRMIDLFLIRTINIQYVARTSANHVIRLVTEEELHNLVCVVKS